MVTSDFSPEVEIRPFRACTMHPAIIIGTVRSLLTWLWGRYHVPQNAFLVTNALRLTIVVGRRGLIEGKRPGKYGDPGLRGRFTVTVDRITTLHRVAFNDN